MQLLRCHSVIWVERCRRSLPFVVVEVLILLIILMLKLFVEFFEVTLLTSGIVVEVTKLLTLRPLTMHLLLEVFLLAFQAFVA